MKKGNISTPRAYRDDFIADVGEMAVAMIEARTVCGETSEEENGEGADPSQLSCRGAYHLSTSLFIFLRSQPRRCTINLDSMPLLRMGSLRLLVPFRRCSACGCDLVGYEVFSSSSSEYSGGRSIESYIRSRQGVMKKVATRTLPCDGVADESGLLAHPLSCRLVLIQASPPGLTGAA